MRSAARRGVAGAKSMSALPICTRPSASPTGKLRGAPEPRNGTYVAPVASNEAL